jgi:diacylglycerol O-acyltransferase
MVVPGAARVRRWLEDLAHGDPSRMASVDRAWLRMDDPTNLMIVNALLLLREPLPVEELRELIAARLGWIRRMRSCVAPGRLWGRWELREIDLHAHVVESALPDPGDDAVLRERLGELISEPLPASRPLWQLRVIQNYRPEGRGAPASVVLCRVHHSLGDGLAQLMVLLSLTDVEAEAASNPLQELFAGAEAEAESAAGREAAIERARSFIHEVMPTGMKLLLHRDHLAHEQGAAGNGGTHASPSAVELARRSLGFAWAGGRDLASLLLRRPDSHTVFRGRLVVAKRVAWSRPIPLARIKAVGTALGDTVNDVLLAALTGALRRYLLARGQSPEGVELRAAVPINLRRLAQLRELGNRFGLVFLTLPVGIEDPRERLAELHRRMDALKHSVEPVVTWGILELMGSSPKLVERLILDYFAKRVSFVMTNVPGPERPLYLAGREIDGVMFWVPQSGRVGLGLSIFSYAGSLRIGVASDAHLVPDPQVLVEKFHEELAELGC